jgi:hypothetical protein
MLDFLYQNKAEVAQLVEHFIRKEKVVSSILASASKSNFKKA